MFVKATLENCFNGGKVGTVLKRYSRSGALALF